MYHYAVRRVVRVVDGDTVDLDVDLGFHLSAVLRFRLLGVDTPERSDPLFGAAAAFTRAWLIARAPRLRVATSKADGFGRWLADVYVVEDPEAPYPTTDHLGSALIRAGLARPYLRG